MSESFWLGDTNIKNQMSLQRIFSLSNQKSKRMKNEVLKWCLMKKKKKVFLKGVKYSWSKTAKFFGGGSFLVLLFPWLRCSAPTNKRHNEWPSPPRDWKLQVMPVNMNKISTHLKHAIKWIVPSSNQDQTCVWGLRVDVSMCACVDVFLCVSFSGNANDLWIWSEKISVDFIYQLCITLVDVARLFCVFRVITVVWFQAARLIRGGERRSLLK